MYQSRNLPCLVSAAPLSDFERACNAEKPRAYEDHGRAMRSLVQHHARIHQTELHLTNARNAITKELARIRSAQSA